MDPNGRQWMAMVMLYVKASDSQQIFFLSAALILVSAGVFSAVFHGGV